MCLRDMVKYNTLFALRYFRILTYLTMSWNGEILDCVSVVLYCSFEFFLLLAWSIFLLWSNDDGGNYRYSGFTNYGVLFERLTELCNKIYSNKLYIWYEGSCKENICDENRNEILISCCFLFNFGFSVSSLVQIQCSHQHRILGPLHRFDWMLVISLMIISLMPPPKCPIFKMPRLSTEIDGLVQDCAIPSACALEIPHSYTLGREYRVMR